MNKRDAQLCDSLTTQLVLWYFFVTVLYLQTNHTIYGALWLDLGAIDGPNVNKLPKKTQFLIIWMYSNQKGNREKGNIRTSSCYHSDTQINAGKYFQLLEKDEIAYSHAECTWLSEAARHHLSIKCLFLWQPPFWGWGGGGGCWQGSLSSQFTTLASVTDSEPQICTESCLDNCQLTPSFIAIKDEGSFFSISLWLPSRRLLPKCRGIASSPPSHRLIIDDSFPSDSVYNVFLHGGFILHNGFCVEWSRKESKSRSCMSLNIILWK